MNLYTLAKRLLALLVILVALTSVGCKKDDVAVTKPDTEAIDADSSSFSALLVDCSTSETTTYGITVINIQRFFKKGKVTSTDITGKIFIARQDARNQLTSAIHKMVGSFNANDPSLKNAASFSTLSENIFKNNGGFIRAVDIDKSQTEQLFKGDKVLIAGFRQQNKREMSAAALLASAGLGSIARTSAETVGVNGFLASFSVGTKTIGVANDYTQLGAHFKVIPDIRSSALMANGIISASSYGSAGYKGGLSYNFPLPPSPSPMYGAPTWFWEQLAIFENVDPFTQLPSQAISKGVVMPNFENFPKQKNLMHNATIVGNSVEFAYTSDQPTASLSLKDTVDISNGYETEYEFIGEKGQFLEVDLYDKNWAYDGSGIGLSEQGSLQIGFPRNQIVVEKKLPSLFDGKKHTVKIRLANRATNTISLQIFVDDMSAPAYEGLYLKAKDIQSYYVTGWKDPHATRRFVSLVAWSKGGGEGKIRINRWSFTAL